MQYKVIITTNHIQAYDMLEWLNDNIGMRGADWDIPKQPNYNGELMVWFTEESDAVAFKLRWG